MTLSWSGSRHRLPSAPTSSRRYKSALMTVLIYALHEGRQSSRTPLRPSFSPVVEISRTASQAFEVVESSTVKPIVFRFSNQDQPRSTLPCFHSNLKELERELKMLFSDLFLAFKMVATCESTPRLQHAARTFATELLAHNVDMCE